MKIYHGENCQPRNPAHRLNNVSHSEKCCSALLVSFHFFLSVTSTLTFFSWGGFQFEFNQNIGNTTLHITQMGPQRVPNQFLLGKHKNSKLWCVRCWWLVDRWGNKRCESWRPGGKKRFNLIAFRYCLPQNKDKNLGSLGCASILVIRGQYRIVTKREDKAFNDYFDGLPTGSLLDGWINRRKASLIQHHAGKCHVHRAPGLMRLAPRASALYTTPVRVPWTQTSIPPPTKSYSSTPLAMGPYSCCLPCQ